MTDARELLATRYLYPPWFVARMTDAQAARMVSLRKSAYNIEYQACVVLAQSRGLSKASEDQMLRLQSEVQDLATKYLVARLHGHPKPKVKPRQLAALIKLMDDTSKAHHELEMQIDPLLGPEVLGQMAEEMTRRAQAALRKARSHVTAPPSPRQLRG